MIKGSRAVAITSVTQTSAWGWAAMRVKRPDTPGGPANRKGWALAALISSGRRGEHQGDNHPRSQATNDTRVVHGQLEAVGTPVRLRGGAMSASSAFRAETRRARAAKAPPRRKATCQTALAAGQAGHTGKPIGDTLDRTKDRGWGCQRPIRRRVSVGLTARPPQGPAWNGSLWALSESAWGDWPAASRR